MNKYVSCKKCIFNRKEGDLEAALSCQTCHGTGIVKDSRYIKCNKCGGSLVPVSKDNDVGMYGLVDQCVSGGWHSDHLTDLHTYRFSLCEKCIVEMFDNFTIHPEVFSSVGGKVKYTKRSK